MGLSNLNLITLKPILIEVLQKVTQESITKQSLTLIKQSNLILMILVLILTEVFLKQD
jgi:hypothetical protein